MASAGSIDPALVTPEYLAEDCGAQLVITAVIFICIECLIYFTRLYSRISTKVPWGKDDLLIALGLVANVAQCVLAAVMVSWAGVGQHLIKWVLDDPSKIVHEFQGLLAMEWTYGLAVCLPKLAILELYIRIFAVKSFRIACYCTMVIIFLTFLATGLTATFQCTPIAAQWDRTIPGAHCIDELAFFRWVSFPNIVTDIVMVALPIPMILRLQLNQQKKFELLAIFVCGGAGLIFSIVRFTLFFNTNAFADTTYTSSILMIITCVEPGIYFICACLPGMRPLLNGLRNKLSSYRRSTANTASKKNTSSRRPSSHHPFQKIGRSRPTDSEIAMRTFDDDKEWMSRDESQYNKSITSSNAGILVTTEIESTSRAQSTS